MPTPPVILDYETPKPVRPRWRRVIASVLDPARIVCCLAFGLIMLTPMVRNSERPTMIAIAVALVMFVAGLRDDKPLT